MLRELLKNFLHSHIVVRDLLPILTDATTATAEMVTLPE